MKRATSWLRGLFVENPTLKVLSGIFAFLVWCSVGADSEREQSFRMRVSVRDIPAGWVLMEEPGDIVVTVRGRERVLRALAVDSMRVAEIGPLEAGQRLWQIRPNDLDLPDGLTVRTITPSEVVLRLEERITQRVPVSLAMRGSVAPGYELLSARVIPEEVEISAPASYFPELRTIDTETIDLYGMMRAVRRRVALAPQRPFIHWDRDIAFVVELDVAVVEEERSLSELPLRPTGPNADRCEPQASVVRALLRGPRSLVTPLDQETLFATVDCGDDAERTGRFIGAVTLHNVPAAITVVERIPSDVLFQLVARPPAPPPTLPPAPEAPPERGPGDEPVETPPNE